MISKRKIRKMIKRDLIKHKNLAKRMGKRIGKSIKLTIKASKTYDPMEEQFKNIKKMPEYQELGRYMGLNNNDIFSKIHFKRRKKNGGKRK